MTRIPTKRPLTSLTVEHAVARELERLQAQIDRLRAENAGLREALRPLAKGSVRNGDCNRAAELLAAIEKGGEHATVIRESTRSPVM